MKLQKHYFAVSTEYCRLTRLIKSAIKQLKTFFRSNMCADSPERPGWSAGTRLWLRWYAVSVHLTGWYPAPEGRKILHYKVLLQKRDERHDYTHKCVWHSPPRVTKEITAYFPHCCCMKKSNMTELWLNKASPAPHTHKKNPRCTVMMTNDSAAQWAAVGALSRPGKWKDNKEFKENGTFYCDTDPLPDLCLVPLWKDVDVRLKRAGLDDSFVSGGHRDRDRTQMRTVTSC